MLSFKLCLALLLCQCAFLAVAGPLERGPGFRRQDAGRKSSEDNGVCCTCSTAGNDNGHAGVFLFHNATKCSLICCQNWNASYTVIREEDASVCTATKPKSVLCSGDANCSCNTLSYPDRVSCCKSLSPQCKFLEAYYPTRPEGLCVRNRTLLDERPQDERALGKDTEGHAPRHNSHHVHSEAEYTPVSNWTTGVEECPGCSANPTKAACELIHGCCACCSVPNPCKQQNHSIASKAGEVV